MVADKGTKKHKNAPPPPAARPAGPHPGASTSLHLACWGSPNLAVVTALLKGGAGLDLVDDRGYTATMLAADVGQAPPRGLGGLDFIPGNRAGRSK